MTDDVYVALGSSFAAGPGILPVLDRTALRSGRNYPQLAADTLGLRLVDVTSSGATTVHLLREQQGRARPQLEAVGPEARLVTVTAGGNDLSYVGGLITASVRGWVARRLPGPVRGLVAGTPVPVSPDAYRAVAASLAEVVSEVRARAPRARVLLVDYLTLIGPDTVAGRDVPLDEAWLGWARETAAGLAGAFARAADESGARLVAASEASAGHGLGSSQPWVGGFRFGNPRRGGPVPYHPNAEGMAAVAALVAGT
ncbi:SGNH/GDSL hydrolase family protein [Amycolatopsis ultiminotia]|uniref:SGNH/GDSL hydrolase family protein n=1 Tax=Amycolatopsis ultiminotia TaxID=543629 RepID=A0ABP6UYY1_9PSEU